MFDILLVPLGKLMAFIYHYLSFENYGVAIVIFTILTKLALLPLTIKQYQGTANMQRLNPKLEELKRQYGSDKQRLNEETMKLYQQEKINPMGSCLPLLIQFPIIIALYNIITRPLQYMIGKSQEQITALKELYLRLSETTSAYVQDLQMLNFFKTSPESMKQAVSGGLLAETDLINMNFLGLDLSKTPTYSTELLFGPDMSTYLPLLLVPLVGVVSTYISSRVSMLANAQQAQTQQSSMNKTMMLMGPIMTLIFSFQLPAGVLIYWIAGYIIQIAQQLYINERVLKIGWLGNKKPPAPDAPRPAAGKAQAKGGSAPALASGDSAVAGGGGGAAVGELAVAAQGASGAQGGAIAGGPAASGGGDAVGGEAAAGGSAPPGAEGAGAQGKKPAGSASSSAASSQRSSANKNYGSTKHKKKK
ncbi:MAG: YidC/Oxa1 family membrane protein insertase [Clostridiales bacterium]|jgi:YidC/Oxa1 family membrane protein insertase|nr:YidC/Oxa1 family membrane protein insertase [Clostridiales bacterium]